MGKPDAPAPPNPADTARASTSTNVGTSIANAFLNNTNQNTPEGSLRYDVTGNYTWYDPYTGMNVGIPTFTATQSLTPQGQAIQDQTMASKLNLAGMANTQSSRLAQHLATNINTSGAPAAGDPSSITGVPQAATTFGDAGDITRDYGPADNFSADRSRVEEALYGRLNPQLARERKGIEQQLADQGIRYGSQAYTSAMDDYSRQANDARLAVTQTAGTEQQRMNEMAAQRAQFQNSAQAAAYQQAAGRGEFQNAGLAQQMAQGQTGFNAQNMARNQYMNEQYALRNQPINEISSLLSGSQISNPNFVNTPNNQIPTTDVAGLINTRFSQDMDIYKQESAQQQALMGGLFGLAGGMMKMSDERMKDDIRHVGAVPMASVFKGDADHDEPGSVLSPRELPIYEYSYRHDPSGARHVGPMAQDVEKIDPRAVKTRKGIKYIDQSRVMGGILKAA